MERDTCFAVLVIAESEVMRVVGFYLLVFCPMGYHCSPFTANNYN